MKKTRIVLISIVLAVSIFVYIRTQVPPHDLHEATSTPISVTAAPSRSLQVEGMSPYVDTDFGFSFWYPNSWHVTTKTATSTTLYQGGEIKGVITISNGIYTVTIDKVYSASSTILDRTGVGACPVCSPMRYYFDQNSHTWMLQYPEGSSMNGKAVTRSADITDNTMGGLHMFPGSRRFHGNVIIPLSAHNFLVVTVDGGMATGFMNAQALAKTIVATDPSVATSVSQSEQEHTITAEKEAYTNLHQ